MSFACARCRTALVIPPTVATQGGTAYCSACGTPHIFAAPPRNPPTHHSTKSFSARSLFRSAKLIVGVILFLYMSCAVRSACDRVGCGTAPVASERQGTESASPEPPVDAQQQAAALAAKASQESALRAGAETAAYEINAELSEVQALVSAGRLREADALLKKSDTRLQEYQALEPVPPEIVAIQKLFEQRRLQVVYLLLPLDLSASMEQSFNYGEQIVADASTQDLETWLAASKMWEKALIPAMALEQMDETQRPYVHAELKEIRKKIDARLKKAERVLKPYFKQQALLKLCGPAPEGCGGGWDGACIGAQSAFKRIAHDPGSVDVENCSQPELSSKHCWVSTCEVRAKNAFGAKIRSVHKFSFSTLGIEVLN